MNELDKISPDDPRLTAFALGEMDDAECAAFERQLALEPEARAWVEEIRATVAALEPALAAEPAPAATAAGRGRSAPVLRFPQAYFAAAGLAAACFGVYFVVHELRTRPSEGGSGTLAVQHVAAEKGSADFGASVAGAPAPDDARAVGAAGRPAFQLVAGEPGAPDRFFSTSEALTSTFPLHLGRGSLAAVREQLRRGKKPGRETVHVAEMINAFDYAWPEAAAGEAFVTLLEETSSPWAPNHRLVRVGVKGVGPSGAVAAREARVRVDFNPARVRAWRLIGFERDDAALGVRGLSAGETVRGGDTVTALYEILPTEGVAAATETALLTLALSYRDEAGAGERVVTRRLEPGGAAFARASADMKFVAAVAAFGLRLRESPMQAPVPVGEMAAWAAEGAGHDDLRLEWVELMRSADAIVR